MTTEELRAMIEAVIESKLSEWLGDPDEGLELSEPLRERITRQRAAYAAGQPGRSLQEVAQRLGLD
jgi:hypothetical protein